MDEIRSIYVDMVASNLFEMTVRMSADVGMMAGDNARRFDETALKLQTKKEIDPGLIINSTRDGMRHITTKDGKAIHMAQFSHNDPSAAIPFTHHIQNIVDTDKDNAPRGISRRVMFDHMETHNVPIVSDDKQTDDGHKMWRKLVPEAIDKGYHAYYWDSQKLHKTTHANLEEHLNSCFGEDPNKRMVISKEPIRGFD